MGRMYLCEASQRQGATKDADGRKRAGDQMAKDDAARAETPCADTSDDESAMRHGADDRPGEGDMRRFVRATLQARLAAMGVVFPADADEETLRRLARVAGQRQMRRQGRTGVCGREHAPTGASGDIEGGSASARQDGTDGEGESHGQ